MLESTVARSVVRMRVRFGETDLMGIAHHASYLSYMEVARIEWLRRRGIAYASWAAADLHLPVVDLSIRYRAPLRFDDEIDVEATLGELRVVSVRFDYRILRAQDGLLCAEGSTKLACVDGRGALRRISEDMLRELTAGEGAR